MIHCIKPQGSEFDVFRRRPRLARPDKVISADTTPSFRLFSYGTLQLPQVQRAVYGRDLDGRPDALAGWALRPLEITDAEVVRLSGLAVHTIARRTGNPEDRIPGQVFTLSAQELEATDGYEVDAYGRVEVELESGLTAFIYVAGDWGAEA